MNNITKPELYGATWCEKTIALKEFLDLHNVSYLFFDIDEDQEAESKVKNLNEGQVKIPVVLVKNTIMKNPSIAFLDQKLTESGLLDPI